ncbi:prepilin-type N-terminal cleavage/methylation domain-containing protein [Aerococcus urinaeequi]|uniref:prepilin-type N-terminal cleavage/methylation domain-containing protein n=1 Tax=Aerococcus urinaeequi TaxID=51665 RepID=UPI000740F2A9|nr:prepilin-type N-terminal cleavage/methylation domain-containing protein [Aerococcus urinaeequi]MCY7730849.1 prepilin-type N-terminal cleavage/methylation domain-containing protein [Aerococcus urinaeequi]
MKKYKRKSGFTLLEMILVLFALSLSLILAVPYAKDAIIRYESKVMMRNVMQHFEYVHKMTIVRKGIHFVTFSGNTVEYRADLLRPSPVDTTFVFPKESKFVHYKRFEFSTSGTVGPQTITLRTPTKDYAIVYQFSGGRYVIEEKKPIDP